MPLRHDSGPRYEYCPDCGKLRTKDKTCWSKQCSETRKIRRRNNLPETVRGPSISPAGKRLIEELRDFQWKPTPQSE